MKKLASVGVSLLVVVVTLSMLAGPADARRRHHRHHRGGGGGGGIVCGPGTTLVNGVCTANPPVGPVGQGNVAISPSSVTMNLNGTFAASVVVSGLPPNTQVVFGNLGGVVLCAAGVGIVAPSGAAPFSDALGRAQFNLASSGAGCVPGTYPLTFTEVASPFQTFTGFLTLHF